MSAPKNGEANENQWFNTYTERGEKAAGAAGPAVG